MLTGQGDLKEGNPVEKKHPITLSAENIKANSLWSEFLIQRMYSIKVVKCEKGYRLECQLKN